ncbi:MAG TPA: hypothetical protein VKN99_03450 [Polyangia bacterium]|nr:hypothetical protein [Polyangia bacterium]
MGWLVLALLLAPGAASAPAAAADVPTVSARADRTEARVGDVVTVVVTAVYRRDLVVNLPPRVDLGKFTVVDRSDGEAPRDLGDGHYRREFILHVAAYEPGHHQIPPLELTYLSSGGELRTLETAAIEVKVGSLLANVPDPKLKDNAPPVRVMESVVWPYYALGAFLAALALAGLSIYLWQRRLLRGRAGAQTAPVRPVHEIALARLDALRKQGLHERAEWKAFYLAVSEIIREYLGARYGFDSLEMTTTELVAALRERALGGADEDMIARWCAACDLVKFARYVPILDEAHATLDGAYRIVDATRVREAAVALPQEVKVDAA